MRGIILSIGLGAIALSAPAAERTASRGEAQIERRLQGMIPGPPEDCITPSRTEGSTHAGNTVLFRGQFGGLYRAQFQNGCTADEDDALILRTTSTRLCRGEIVEVRDTLSGFDRGSCVYDQFVPYHRPGRTK